MNKLALYLFAGLLTLGVAACKKDAVSDFQQRDDEALVAAIANDQGKPETDPSTLPAEILDYIGQNHFDSYIDAAYFADGKGYEVVLATEERVFFNLNRRILAHRLNDRIGPCGRVMGGRLIPLDELRPAIVDYVATNYPDAQILRAKRQGDRVILLLRGHIVLVFTGDGVFEVDGLHWVDCRPCAPADAVDIPANVVTMIENRIPGGEIKRVCRRGGRIVVGVFGGDHRHILVFDSNWNFLFHIP